MTATTLTQPEDLRNRMVDHIKAHLHSSDVEQALRTVPRHLFVPEASVEDDYANKAITTKPGGSNGRPASCASVPTVVAMMLGQLDARTGDRILEIGAGTGYNAALLAALVGDTGQVTTIDLDPDVTEQARRALDETGYGRVHVVTGDGALGTQTTPPTTGSSSRSARGTCRPLGWTSSPPAAVLWCRCTGEARPEEWPSPSASAGHPAGHRQPALRLHPDDRRRPGR